MHTAIEQMLKRYHCQSQGDFINALKEIFQEIALLALWRAKFYEKAAFYGGSALRIMHGLNRFSEDLDFTLLKSDKTFELDHYNKAITEELNGFGFDVTFTKKKKNRLSNIESAFIKADTKNQLIEINAPDSITKRIHRMDTIKIKMEVDIFPPGKFSTEVKTLLVPLPFTVKILTLPDLFAGKIHAILCRPWVKRVKGRDWYDFIWYISQKISVNVIHLRERLIQSNAWDKNRVLTRSDLIELLNKKINETDFSNAKQDVMPFINDPQSIALWDKKFFREIIKTL